MAGVIDETEVENFAGKVLGDSSGFTTTILCALGDRLGLFDQLASGGPCTAFDLAARAGVDERYVREWAAGLVAAGYLGYACSTGVITLPDSHVPVLAQEGGPVFFGGIFEMVSGAMGVIPQLERSFRRGGGVSLAEYDEHFWDGMERFTRGRFDNYLLQEWVPALPDVEAKLQAGARLADVGCGRGWAILKLAQAYPRSTFVGYDNFAPSVEVATDRAKLAGVDDCVRFEHRDVSTGLPERYDIITTFDVVHDAVDPARLLRVLCESLDAGGIYVCLDINASHKLEDNCGPLGAMFYGVSILYCMTTSLAGGGAGLGTCGFNERVATEMGTAAGFSSVRRVPLVDPFNNLYELRP